MSVGLETLATVPQVGDDESSECYLNEKERREHGTSRPKDPAKAAAYSQQTAAAPEADPQEMEDCLSRGSGANITERATMSDGVHPGTNAGAASEDRPPTADTSAPPPTGLTWQTTGTLPPGPAIPAA